MKKEIKSTKKKIYIAPDIEVVEIETEQNILNSGSGELSDFGGENW